VNKPLVGSVVPALCSTTYGCLNSEPHVRLVPALGGRVARCRAYRYCNSPHSSAYPTISRDQRRDLAFPPRQLWSRHDWRPCCFFSSPNRAIGSGGQGHQKDSFHRSIPTELRIVQPEQQRSESCLPFAPPATVCAGHVSDGYLERLRLSGNTDQCQAISSLDGSNESPKTNSNVQVTTTRSGANSKRVPENQPVECSGQKPEWQGAAAAESKNGMGYKKHQNKTTKERQKTANCALIVPLKAFLVSRIRWVAPARTMMGRDCLPTDQAYTRKASFQQRPGR